MLVAAALVCLTSAAGGPWEHVGPWNIFDAYDPKGDPTGEAGTLACASSPASKPNIIYAGGQNNGVSSGIIKTVDGGKHWTRNSNGLWDTQVLGVWVYPDDASGDHVLAGTHSGVYESTDGAASWKFCSETKGWGNVMSFRTGTINGKKYVLANNGNGILTRPYSGGTWQKIKAPGGIASNAHLSVVQTGPKLEVLTCIGGWGGGDMYYASLDSPTSATWTGPITPGNKTYTDWEVFPSQSAIWGRCKTPTSCNPDVHLLGVFGDIDGCKKAVNATTFKLYTWTYQHNVTALGDYAGHCYGMSSSDLSRHPQGNVDSGRAPGVFPGEAIDCCNSAVDPNDRNHFLYSKGGAYHVYESKDGGKTVNQIGNQGVFFVMIDNKGYFYTATQDGAFVSDDDGKTWTPYHVIMHRKDGSIMDRVPHDYQRIVPDFRGDNIAFPSDQGLHIVDKTNKTNYRLTSAVGDMHNAMSLSALISPSTTKPGSRNLVVNMWDWDVCMSKDDGATWSGWNKTEKSPGSCGEGGGGMNLGTSGQLIMCHHQHWWSSSDGGHNFIRGDLPGICSPQTYIRKAGSRTEPSGKSFAILDAPPPSYGANGSTQLSGAASADGTVVDGLNYSPDASKSADSAEVEISTDGNEKAKKAPYDYNFGLSASVRGNVKYLMTSEDFGQNWTWTPLPKNVQAGMVVADPTTSSSLFAVTSNCLSHSTDDGKTWSTCSTAKGLTGRFTKLAIKDSKTMFMIRSGAAPLRTTDGGSSWQELTKAAPLYKYGMTLDCSISWSGKTLVLHGNDRGAIGRGEYGSFLWKSTNDGDDWTDETGDLVTISMGQGVWYEKDFYLVTQGEGVIVKRNFEA